MTTDRGVKLATILHALDPDDGAASTPEQRLVLLDRLTSDRGQSAASGLHLELMDVPATTSSARQPRRRLAVAGAVAAVVIAVAAGVIVVHGWQSGIAVPANPPSPHPVESVDPTTIKKAEQLVLASSPLAKGRQMSCMDFTFPAWRLAIPGGAENGNSAEAAGLRRFLGGPQNTMSPQSGSNWVALAQTDGKVLFGQRQGALGIGSAVVLARRGWAWTFAGSGGCGTGLIPGPGEKVQHIDTAHIVGPTLQLAWEGGDDNCTTTVVKRVETQRDAAGLHVLVVTHTQRVKNLPPGTACLGVGVRRTADVSLPNPLGAVPIFDDSSVPSIPVPLNR